MDKWKACRERSTGTLTLGSCRSTLVVEEDGREGLPGVNSLTVGDFRKEKFRKGESSYIYC